MRDLDIALAVLQDRGRRHLPLKRVYRPLYNPELYLRAYGKIYRNAGALTPGTDPEDTIDGMSLKRIERLIADLADDSFEWKPARRIYIPKKNGELRPLGIPGWKDKLLQEAIRIILDAYYEPQFSPNSHGFRPNRGCHTALESIRYGFAGTAWFIEGDIKGCFDNIRHDVLLRIMVQDIHDARLIGLLSKLLQAGYMEDWQYHKTYSGTPQGGVISPLLANTFLHELDRFVDAVLVPAFTRGKMRRSNRAYKTVQARSHRAFRSGNLEEGRHWRKIARTMTSTDSRDPDFRRLKYVRYADDFLLGFIGPKAEAKEIRQQLAAFLSAIGLELSLDKTKITHARTERARFLGYDIKVCQNNTRWCRQANGVTRRSVNGRIWFGVPHAVVRDAMRRYSREGKAIHKSERLMNSPFTIVSDFQTEYRGLAEYYAYAHNRSQLLPRLRITMTRSLGKTLAAKLGISSAEVFRRHMATKIVQGQPRRVLSITVKREGKPDLEAYWGGISLARRDRADVRDVAPQIYSNRTELVEGLLASTCEICGSQEGIQVHHIRALRDINKPGGRAKAEWETKMIARRRKTLIVCDACHHKIHNGQM